MALTDKTRKVNFIVSCDGSNYDDLLRLSDDIPNALAALDVIEYAFIVHSLDVKDDGTLKTPHFHVVAHFPTARRLSTYLRKFSDLLGLNTLAVSVEVCRSFEGSVQYLIHKNDPDKHQYDPALIHTNMGEDTLNLYLTAEIDDLTIDRLIELCRNYPRPIMVARKIGLGRYQIYRRVIEDIYIELHHQAREKQMKGETA